MNPKEIFLKELITNVERFELATGVYIRSIDFERFSTKNSEDIIDKSVIISIELNFK